MTDIDVRKLAERLDAAQAILDEIRVACGCDIFGPPKDRPKRVETALETAQRAYEQRQRRTDFVGTKDLFGEPAWDMLLDLFIRQTRAEQITIKSTCINSDAPVPTVVRWLKVLEHNGLIMSDFDPADRKRLLLNLSPTGYEGMLRYLESFAR